METHRTAPDFGSGSITAVAYGNGLWVAVGPAGQLATTTDPTSGSWTSRISGFGGTLIDDVHYADGKWLAVGSTYLSGDLGTKYATSTDGLTWAAATFPGSTQYTGAKSIAYGGGRWVVLAFNGHWSSPDAQTWTGHNLGGSATTGVGGGLDVAYGAGRFIVVGVDAFIWMSTDGLNFRTVDNGGFWTNPQWDLLAVAFGNGVFATAGGVEEFGSASVTGGGP